MVSLWGVGCPKVVDPAGERLPLEGRVARALATGLNAQPGEGTKGLEHPGEAKGLIRDGDCLIIEVVEVCIARLE